MLDINFFKQSVDVTESDLSSECSLPEQYHFNCGEIAIGLYYSIHHPLDPNTNLPMVNYGKNRVQSAMAEITGQTRDPRGEDNLDAQVTLYQPGYEMGGIR